MVPVDLLLDEDKCLSLVGRRGQDNVTVNAADIAPELRSQSKAKRIGVGSEDSVTFSFYSMLSVVRGAATRDASAGEGYRGGAAG